MGEMKKASISTKPPVGEFRPGPSGQQHDDSNSSNRLDVKFRFVLRHILDGLQHRACRDAVGRRNGLRGIETRI